MTIEVQVVSKETIRPSSPTPSHLQSFPLSGIDQLAPSLNIPFYLLYPTNSNDKTDNHLRIHHLKQSLAETLTHIYPLAGRITDNKHVACNDEGVNFFVARASGDNFSQFLSYPQPEELQKLLPRDELLASETKALLSVQVNFFHSEGMALAVLISHKLADAVSTYLFLNCWSRIARGDKEIQPPKLGTTSTFPPSNFSAFVPPTTTTLEKIITKRFVFSPTNIASLRASFLPNRPSRAAAVIALIWSCVANAKRVIDGANTTSAASFSINLRPKRIPDLSENSMGNCLAMVTTTPTEKNYLELPNLVDKLREALRIFDSEYVKQLKAGDLLFVEPFREVNELCIKGEVDRYSYTSLCNIKYYETDFGWGKPVWVSVPANVGHKNVILLMDTKCGAGVEAWVCLEEEHMDKFEHDPDLIAFISPINAATWTQF